MRLHELPKTVNKKAKRVGRGPGSGKGQMAGRGSKGQLQREGTRHGFEGGQTRLAIRFPLMRGKGFVSIQEKPVVINLSRIDELFNDGDTVTFKSLVEKGVIKKSSVLVKVLGGGKLTKKITLSKELKLSGKAQEKVGPRK